VSRTYPDTGKKKENDVCDDIANNSVVEEHRWSLEIERFVFFSLFSFLARCASSMPPRRDDSDERRQRFVFLFFECL
jgi:hypothetical protein